MTPLTPTYRVLLGDVTHFQLLVVGVGGTGSALVHALAGLCYHAQQKGIRVDVTLMDADRIEPKNVGRQTFGVAPAVAGGVPKVADIALRLNAAYGLDMTAWPVAYTHARGMTWLHNCSYQSQPLLIGCVDNTPARQALAQTVQTANGRLWCLECGNDRTNGQVLIGNVTDVANIHFDDTLHLCTGFPSPYIQEPTLCQPEPVVDLRSCAERIWQAEQSLMVNRFTAALAGHILTQFILHREVTQLGAYFNLAPTVMTPILPTKITIERSFASTLI